MTPLVCCLSAAFLSSCLSCCVLVLTQLVCSLSAAGPLSCCRLPSTLLRGTAAGSSAAGYTPVQLPIHLRRWFHSTFASAAASAAHYLPLHYVTGFSSIVAGSSPHGRLYCRIVILGCCSALSAYRVAPAIRETLDCECTGQASLHVRWVQLWALEVRLPRVSQRLWSSASPD